MLLEGFAHLGQGVFLRHPEGRLRLGGFAGSSGIPGRAGASFSPFLQAGFPRSVLRRGWANLVPGGEFGPDSQGLRKPSDEGNLVEGGNRGWYGVGQGVIELLDLGVESH